MVVRLVAPRPQGVHQTGSTPVTLTDDDALHIIQQHPQFGTQSIVLTQISYGQIDNKSPLGQEISRLASEGYLTQQTSYMAGCDPTPKGQGMIGHCVWNSLYGGSWEVVTLVGVEPKPTRVISKMIDSKAGVAVVQYELSWTPTEYLKKLCQLDKDHLGVMVSQQIGQYQTSGQFTLKLWDDGWHIQ
jgi:hypothetical protein